MTQEEKKEVEVLSEAMKAALREVFGENVKTQRFIDVTRIPLICKSIIETNVKLKHIDDKLDHKYVTKDSFLPVRTIVYGLVGLILTAVVLAILALVLR